jgi:hypothetical protein
MLLIAEAEILARSLTVFVCREYLDFLNSIPKHDRIILAYIDESACSHPVPRTVNLCTPLTFACGGMNIIVRVKESKVSSLHKSLYI